ncbi:thermonuclease family protein [Arcanobacterium phocae]|uniref:thermonuclease family protein n=1 Tax=Arcanobacterium phocae TaxID=131112 RepID=UPI001C0F2602|nr:thermonuclease family protein [Arcanobacterium phocae]
MIFPRFISKHKFVSAVAALAIIGGASTLVDDPKSGQEQGSSEPVTAEVVKVMSSDSVLVSLGSGVEQTIRLAGIRVPNDTPDAYECLGDEARQLLEKLAPVGTPIAVKKNASQPDESKYWLADIVVNNELVSEQIVRSGLAVLSLSDEDEAYRKQLENAVEDAKSSHVGVYDPTVQCLPQIVLADNETMFGQVDSLLNGSYTIADLDSMIEQIQQRDEKSSQYIGLIQRSETFSYVAFHDEYFDRLQKSQKKLEDYQQRLAQLREEEKAKEQQAEEVRQAQEARQAEEARLQQEKQNQQQSSPSAPVNQPSSGPYFGSCKEAKAAGAAPLYLGSPGYRSDLDRDGDGVACER